MGRVCVKYLFQNKGKDVDESEMRPYTFAPFPRMTISRDPSD